jgi:hypothetical protein
LMASSEIPVCRIRPLFGVVITIPILPHHLGAAESAQTDLGQIRQSVTHRETRGSRDPWNLKIGLRDVYAIICRYERGSRSALDLTCH